jgi:3-isopropylmalate dehydrogenase
MTGPAPKKTWSILVLPGDGIGPEVTAEAVKVLEEAGGIFGIAMSFAEGLVGGIAIDAEGAPISSATLAQAMAADAVLLGAVGGPRWDSLPVPRRPERGLLALRGGLDLFANLRPVAVFPALAAASTLKREVVEGIDLVVVRELVSGLYFGKPRGRGSGPGGRMAWNTMRYDEGEIARVARAAFLLAQGRRRRVTSVDKANVLEVSALWREVVEEVARGFPDVALDHQYVDNAAMQLVRRPAQFDVILTENLFGDILSDEAAMLTGSIGMLPSASLGEGRALYEPVHGSAPDIAGTGRANPLAAVLSGAMLLEHTCGSPLAARAVREAVGRVLAEGFRTADLSAEAAPAGGAKADRRMISCREMGDRVAAALAEVGR